jgi:hypothetical protein
MTAQPSPYPLFRAVDSNNNPLVLGQLYTYVAGTTTPQATYTDSTQSTPNANPVPLNARGEAPVWLDPTLTYLLVLKDRFGTQIWSADHVAGGIAAQTPLTLNPPAGLSGPVLTVNAATNWGAALFDGTVQVAGTTGLINANQNVHVTQLLLHGYTAEFVSINSAAGADQKVWSNYADGSGNYNSRIENDALNATYTYLQVARTGNSAIFGSHQPILNILIGYGSVVIQSTIANAYEMTVSGGNTAGFTNALLVKGGSNTGDHAITVQDSSGTHTYLDCRGDGKWTMGPSTSGNTTTLTVTGQASSTAPVATFGGTSSNFITLTDGAGMSLLAQTATGVSEGVLGMSSNHALSIIVNNTEAIHVTSAGAVTLKTAQRSGWGTPTNNLLVNNFPGSAATLAQCGEVISQILIDLEAFGLYAA